MPVTRGSANRATGGRSVAGTVTQLVAVATVLGCAAAGLGLLAVHDRSTLSPHTFDLAAAQRTRRSLQELPAAQRLFEAGDYERAGRIFAAVLDGLPDERRSASAGALLGLPRPGDYGRLLARIQGNLGVCWLRARRFAEAEALLQRAVAGEPDRPRHRANLGVTLLRLRRYGEARAQLERAIALGVDDDKLHLDLAEACLRAGDVARARLAANRASQLAESSTDVASWGTRLEAEELLAQADLEDGRPDDSEVRLRRVLARAPGSVSARHRLIRLLLRAGRNRQAARERARFDRDAALMASIQTALSASPEKVESLRWVAYTYERLGLLHLADAHYRQLLARHPDDPRVTTALHRIRRQVASPVPGRRRSLE